METGTILTGESSPSKPPQEEPRIHFENEHLLESVSVPREPHPRFPTMDEPPDEVLMRDLPEYVTARIGDAMFEGRLHKTLTHFANTIGVEALIGDVGMNRLKGLAQRAYENRFDPEMSRQIGAEAQEWVSQWQIVKK